MKFKKRLWLAAGIACLALALSALFFYFRPARQTRLSPPGAQGGARSEAGSSKTEAGWDALREKNSDIYAWIEVPGTNIDYPVLQPQNGEGDFFYLDHDAERRESRSGAIYSEMQNAKDFSDPVTVLYGHNMADKSMFATLHNFEDADFFKRHDEMYVYMPGRKLTYKIYAAYVYDNRHILNSFDFSDVKTRTEYFRSTLRPLSAVANTRRPRDFGISLDHDSKILTLSTCTGRALGDTRYLVQGVLFQDEPIAR